MKFVIAALLASVNAVTFKSAEDLQQTSNTELNELNRYIGGDGKPINLAETTGHLRLELTKTKRFDGPVDVTALDISSCRSRGPNECPLNKPGEKVATHLE